MMNEQATTDASAMYAAATLNMSARDRRRGYEKFLITLYAFWLFLFLIVAHYGPPLVIPAYLMLTAGYLLAKEVENNREDRANRWGVTNVPVVYSEPKA
jgi:hypothetical protein